jgi:hypothetical protein
MYCHHRSPLFHLIALPQSGQDIQQQRTRGLIKISQHENSTIHTNIKIVRWITQYKQHKLSKVMSCLILYLSHVLLLAVFFMARQIIFTSPTSFGILFYGATVQVGLGLHIFEVLSSHSGMVYTGLLHMLAASKFTSILELTHYSLASILSCF